jgi:hypothetical protein
MIFPCKQGILKAEPQVNLAVMSEQEKEFGKVSRGQVKQAFDYFHQAEQQKKDFDDLITELPEDISAVLDVLPPWAYFYELPENYMAALFLHSIISKEKIQALIKSPDVNQALFDLGGSDIDPDGLLNLDEADGMAILLSITMAYVFNLQAYKLGKSTINALINRVRAGDDDALMEAVYVDRMALACPSIAKRIARATLERDENFFVLLSKSITRTRPKKPPDPKYNDLRFGLELLEQAKGLNNISYEDMFGLLAKELNHYPYTADDTFDSFRRLVQREKRKRAT